MAAARVFQGLQEDQKNSKRMIKPSGAGQVNPILAGSKWEDSGHHQENFHQRRPQERGASTSDSTQATTDSREAGKFNKQKYTSGGAPFATQEQYPLSEGSGGNVYSAPSQSFASQQDYNDDGTNGSHNYEANTSRVRILAKGPVSEFNPITWGTDSGADDEQVASAMYSTSAQQQQQLPYGTQMLQRFKGRVSSHNPVTWEAYDGFSGDEDKPSYRSRFDNPAGGANKQSAFNPITGKDYEFQEDDEGPVRQQQQQQTLGAKGHGKYQ